MNISLILFLVWIGAIQALTPNLPQTTHTLEVEVQEIRQLSGTLRVCLVANKEAFLSSCLHSTHTSVQHGVEVLEFPNLELGTYAVSLYQDLDDNGKLNQEGLFGMPSEPYGFSNNPRSLFRPPSFEKCAFKLSSDSRIVVRL
ncbi:MAG: DUF2141 domain-containing protein [Bacteroidota bacterium]